MNLLLDMNILVSLVRSKHFEAMYKYLNPDNSPIYISVVIEAEIKSIAL